MEIKDIKQDRQPVHILALVTSIDERQTKTGSNFINLLLSDKTGQIEVKMWNTSAIDLENEIEAGHVYEVVGNAGMYNDIPQLTLKMSDFELIPTAQADDYVVGKPSDWSKALDYLKNVLSELQKTDNDYYELVKSLMFEKPAQLGHGASFETQPAAVRIHHAFKGGLAYHTSRMLQQADALAKIYPIVNKPLLQTAILIHDLGKMEEYTPFSATYPTETTINGRLLGHISMVDGWIVEYLTKRNIQFELVEKWALLRHTVLAHHGRLEWGSPVLAITPEAMVINMIDMTDAQFMQYETAYEATGQGSISKDKYFGLNNQRVYKSMASGNNEG